MIDNEPPQFEADRNSLKEWMGDTLITESVPEFVEGAGIRKLGLKFDIDELRRALQEVLAIRNFAGEAETGFGVLPLTRRPGVVDEDQADLSGRYWIRADDRYVEEPMESAVDEGAYSEFTPDYSDTYFAYVHEELSKRVQVGRMRLMWKDHYNCNSWHRDPEPRVHVPIITNPGSLFVVNHHATHLPADGSTYFTQTMAYHTAMNGGLTERVHVVAAVCR